MKFRTLHDWDVTPKQAIAIQTRLRDRVIRHDAFEPVRYLAGVDVGFEDQGRLSRAAVVILDYPSLEQVDQAIARVPTRFPYVPGLLSFREIPALLRAFKKISVIPDIILCDGQGIAHPRQFGIACHLGLILDTPAIGVGKSRLTGVHGKVPALKGRWCPLTRGGEIIGAVLRTRRGVKPVYVSTGHRISLESAIDIVMQCITRYRLPETTRLAHKLASCNP
jgi:deoxyribonuclease V